MLRKFFDEHFDEDDRRWVILAFLGVLLSSTMLFDENFLGRLFGNDDENSAPRVGQVISTTKDIRHKRSGSLSWNSAGGHDTLRVGDGLFSGNASGTDIRLEQGGQMHLGENTLVIFTEVDGIEIPNLMNGKFQLEVNGKMKIALQGQVTEIDGKNAKVQITYEGNKPVLKLLTGNAKIHTAGRDDLDLSHRRSVALNESSPLRVPPAILGVQNTAKVIYHPHFSDRYDLALDQSLRERSAPAWVDQSVILTWTLQGNPDRAYLRLAPTPNAEHARELVGAPYGATLRPVLAGTNYWWVSLDKKSWKGPYRFDLSEEELSDENLAVHFESSTYELQFPQVIIPFNVSSKQKYIGYVVEAASTPDFRPGTRKLSWLSQDSGNVAFTEPGTYYYRVRGVNDRRELTRFSPVQQIDVVYPALPQAPRMSLRDFNVPLGQKVTLRWKNDPQAKTTLLELRDSRGHIVERIESPEKSWTWQPPRADHYSVTAVAIDAWGRKNAGANVALNVNAPPAKAPELPPIPLRTPSAEGTSQFAIEVPRYLNRDYDRSFIELEGAAFTMFSRAQQTAGNGTPEAFMVGLRALHWFGSNGAELNVRGKLASANESASQLSPHAIEARIHHRWMLPFNPFPLGSESQLSLAFGFESYRNGASQDFSPGYDLVKAGLTLEFPAFEHWITGGEILYGLSTDRSHKTEVSGHAQYVFRKDWSMGGGYRVHLFEAGSLSSAPGLLPYREAYGEAYSVFQWRY